MSARGFSLKSTAVLLGLMLMAGLPAQARPLFHTSSEASTQGMAVPSARVVEPIMAAPTPVEIKRMAACVADHPLKPRDYRQLLREVVFDSAPGHRLHVVRGRNDPGSRCDEFYGAHLFVYYLIDETVRGGVASFKVVFQNGGDSLSIYPERRFGLNDIEATGCIVDECSIARMGFDGRSYRPVRCSLLKRVREREVVVPRRCGSDGFQDYQSSGFVQRRKP